MSQTPNAERRTPKEYVRPVKTSMWLERKGYIFFMIRELTAVFVAGYAIFLLALVYRATQGQDAFAAFIEGLKSPLSMALHLIALAMTLYHSVTWFLLGSRVKAIWRGEERVNPAMLAILQYAAWALVSVLVLWIAIAQG